MQPGDHRLTIASDWQGVALREEDVATVAVSFGKGESGNGEVIVSVDAPYMADPPPPGAPGPTEGLWEYEVVELFLATDEASNPSAIQYLEIEISPHGHYLALTFEGIRRRVGSHEAFECSTAIDGIRWQGTIRLDAGLAPPHPLRANAYRLCGAGSDRRYLAAYSVPGEEPDFHRLDRFRELR